MRITTPLGKWLAQRLTIACFLWTWVWILIGNTSRGKQAYLRLAQVLIEDDGKGILPIITLAVPILGSAIIIHAVGSSDDSDSSVIDKASYYLVRMRRKRGDPSFDAYALWMILVPLGCYVASSLLYARKGTTTMSLMLPDDERLLGAANTFGIASLIALCLLFIPVARHSSILKMFQWNPAAAIRLHIWCGRIVVIASLIHGGMHALRFQQKKYPLISTLTPPLECWKWWSNDNDNEINNCSIEREECSCYNRWRNLVGLLGTFGLLVLAFSSLNVVRRRCYAIFYRIHIVAGPFVLLCVMLHWNRSIVYLAGGLVYYMASSFAHLLERRQLTETLSSVEVVEVEHLSPASIRNRKQVVAITFAATEQALAQFQAGCYAKLLAPDISSISHPFTVNRVPHRSHLRIMFRVQGNFTRRLAHALQFPNGDELDKTVCGPPRIILDGYHGAGRLQQVVCHDRVVIVAGGIGITPYLSLLQELVSVPSDKTMTRQVVLHWCCRDESLMAYVEREYLEHLSFDRSPSSCHIRIIIHNTKKFASPVPSYTNLERRSRDLNDGLQELLRSNNNVRPFHPSPFIPLCQYYSWLHNLGLTFSFAVTSVLSLVSVYFTYATIQESDPRSMLPRLWSPVSLILIGLGVALVSTRVMLRDVNEGGGGRDVVESSLEMGCMSCPSDPAVWRQECDCAAKRDVWLERRTGRPPMEELLGGLIEPEAKQPGLLLCGPPALVREVRTSLRKQARYAHVGLYEEKFEL